MPRPSPRSRRPSVSRAARTSISAGVSASVLGLPPLPPPRTSRARTAGPDDGGHPFEEVVALGSCRAVGRRVETDLRELLLDTLQRCGIARHGDSLWAREARQGKKREGAAGRGRARGTIAAARGGWGLACRGQMRSSAVVERSPISCRIVWKRARSRAASRRSRGRARPKRWTAAVQAAAWQAGSAGGALGESGTSGAQGQGEGREGRRGACGERFRGPFSRDIQSSGSLLKVPRS